MLALMKRISLVLMLITVFGGLISAESDVNDKAYREEFSMLVPIGFYTSDTGIAGGGLYQRLFPWGLDVQAIGFYTQKNQVNCFYTLDYTAPSSSWWLRNGGGVTYYPQSFYGAGPETSLDDEEKYTSIGFNQSLKAYYRLLPAFYAGPAVKYRLRNIADPDSGGLIDQDLVTGSEGYQVLRAGAGLGTGRDPLTVAEGMTLAYEAEFYYLTTISGDSASAAETVSDLRWYYVFPGAVHSWESHQLAVQQILTVSSGEMPFAEMPSIGGADEMRGYAADRFRDNCAAFIQADYRFPIYKRFRGAVFGGLGNVGEDITALGESDLKLAWGAGLRYQAGPTSDTSFRLDFAWTGEGSGLYFTFGEAF